ncbi:MAG: LysE family translocator [Cyanobacteria bacterium P01_H01_bin.121]
MEIFWQGFVIGLAIAAPVGPIGILCIRQTLANGWLTGLLTGLGAATADAIYGCIAGFGIAIVARALVQYQTILQIMGGCFLCYLGVKAFQEPVLSPESTSNQSDSTAQLEYGASTLSATEHTPRHEGVFNWSLARVYATTIGLTLSNPATILSFTAIFTSRGLEQFGHSKAIALLLVLGVFLGSACWWLLLSGMTYVLRQHLKPEHFIWINRGSGLVLIAFGSIALSSLGRL